MARVYVIADIGLKVKAMRAMEDAGKIVATVENLSLAALVPVSQFSHR